MKRAWLQPFTWAVIVETNRQLCLPEAALHRPTRDGYEPTRQLWESLHRSEMTLAEATDLCRRCHRLAPFCTCNGNTFVAVIRKVISSLPLPSDQAAAVLSLVGHIVAGTAKPEEHHAFARVIAEVSALAPNGDAAHSPKRELAEHHRPLAETPAAGQGPPPLGNHPGAGGAEHGLRGRAGEPADPSRDTRPERATRFIETTRGVLSHSQLAPLLAGQVVAVQADIEDGLSPLLEIWKQRLAAPEPPTA